ncbi:hypothetical protein JK636_17645 [Clostridium sp. YIM B02515]|uniref:Metallo-beta-lactamase domain-containing protein n=1 Tax=Clostridium rhizosphaerae TaxID=2803861 RepID=A0ABS1TDT1_9CLOT|nr:MBL fold metallo-hydrolase [Clostridium rhizosphaerae]MBL4937543.1 hypothetical protein [Clostridium rhizosphaerae]
MRIQFLGTAAAEGWPALFCTCNNCQRARELKGKNYRSRAQVLINDDLIFDFGPDSFYHAMTFDLDFSKIQTVLMTHSHMDHLYPLDLILRGIPYAYDRDKNKMTIYGNEKCEAFYNRMLVEEDDSANLKDCIDYSVIKAFDGFKSHGYDILPLQAQHDPRENCLVYSLTDKDGKRLFYGNDTGDITEETWNHIKSLYFDVVSLDCTMGGTPGCKSHMGLEETILLRNKMLEVGCADENTKFVITHFSHNGCLLHHELEERVKDLGMLVAYDGMILDI